MKSTRQKETLGVQERVQKRLIFIDKSNGEYKQTLLSRLVNGFVDHAKSFGLYPVDSK